MNIIKKITDKTAIIGIIGLGYVGLPLAVEVAKKNFKVIGFDNASEKVNKINAGNNYIRDIINKELHEVVISGTLVATTNKERLLECDVVLICVPTPLDKNKQPNMSYIRNVEQDIQHFIHKDMLIVLESTTYPGTTEELKTSFEKSGLLCGKDFFLAFSPERIDPGNKEYKTYNTPKVIGGITIKCTEIAETFYNAVLNCSIYRTSSSKVAEMTKLLENTYRNINIALINEFAILCEKMKINIWEVIDAAKTKPFGFQPFYPGPGVGGHCIPLDPYYLSWKATEFNFDFSMIRNSSKINEMMPYYIINRVDAILTEQNKTISGARILISGVAYKANIDDYRESPAIKIIKLLENKSVKLHYYDPHITRFQIDNKLYDTENINDDLLENIDLIIITVGHSKVDYEFIQKKSKLIFDTCNALKEIKNRNNIILL